MSALPERPTLRLRPEAWERLWLYVRLADSEVGGLASVQKQADGFLVTACHLIEQRATDVDTEIEPEAASRFLIQHIEAGGDPAQLRVWWHSHARESVFWSADDERTIDQFGGEWLVSMVGNHAGKWLARFDRYEPKRETIGWLDVLPPGPPPALEGSLADQVREELSRLVHVQPRGTNKLWTHGGLPRRQ